MAISFDLTLTNSKGLNKIILFRGLEFPIVITPSLLGEPLLTAQPFYFLEDLDCVARIRFEKNSDLPETSSNVEFEQFIETLLDNYLFEYVKKYPDSKITSKITEFSYWKNDLNYPYFMYDKMHTDCLVLDTLNDESIIECRDSETGDIYYDWCLVNNYSGSMLEKYIKDLKSIFTKKAHIKVKNNRALGTGEYTLPIIKVNSPLLTYHQAVMFEVISARNFKEGNDFYKVNRGMISDEYFQIPQEVVEVSSYHDRELLSYFFVALRDHSPLTQFRNFYNVIEYFFEEAPQILSMPSKFEYQMIEAVFKWAISPEEMISKINKLPVKTLNAITSEQKTTSGEAIPGLNLNSDDILKEVSGRIYSIRNACMHSKKTRRGIPTPRFVPTTDEENILRNELQLIQWISTKVIEKDTEQ